MNKKNINDRPSPNEEEKSIEQDSIQTDNAADDTQESMEHADLTEKAENISVDQAELIEKLEEQKDKYLRLFAEFENYRRRTSREKLDFLKTASSQIIIRLLPVIDDYERALGAFEKNNDLETYKEGIGLIAEKLYKTLQKEGLEEMNSTGEPFNTDEHEAIARMPVPDEDKKGIVLDTTEKGYKLNDKVIRFAKVVVGN